MTWGNLSPTAGELSAFFLVNLDGEKKPDLFALEAHLKLKNCQSLPGQNRATFVVRPFCVGSCEAAPISLTRSQCLRKDIPVRWVFPSTRQAPQLRL